MWGKFSTCEALPWQQLSVVHVGEPFQKDQTSRTGLDKTESTSFHGFGRQKCSCFFSEMVNKHRFFKSVGNGVGFGLDLDN